jgi:hypothetical protein
LKSDSTGWIFNLSAPAALSRGFDQQARKQRITATLKRDEIRLDHHRASGF